LPTIFLLVLTTQLTIDKRSAVCSHGGKYFSMLVRNLQSVTLAPTKPNSQ
jgi:hypothetical protein